MFSEWNRVEPSLRYFTIVCACRTCAGEAAGVGRVSDREARAQPHRVHGQGVLCAFCVRALAVCQPNRTRSPSEALE